MYFSTSFKHTAREKYEVDFDTSNVDSIGEKLNELKFKVENKRYRDVHVGLEVTLEHVVLVQESLEKIIAYYLKSNSILPIGRKIYDINHRIREAEAPRVSDIAKEVLNEILSPKKDKLTKAERLKIDADAKSKERALKLIQKNKG